MLIFMVNSLILNTSGTKLGKHNLLMWMILKNTFSGNKLNLSNCNYIVFYSSEFQLKMIHFIMAFEVVTLRFRGDNHLPRP